MKGQTDGKKDEWTAREHNASTGHCALQKHKKIYRAGP